MIEAVVSSLFPREIFYVAVDLGKISYFFPLIYYLLIVF